MLKSTIGVLLALTLLSAIPARALAQSSLNPGDFSINMGGGKTAAPSANQPTQPEQDLFPGPLFQTDVGSQQNSAPLQTNVQQKQAGAQAKQSTPTNQGQAQTQTQGQQTTAPAGQSGSSGQANPGNSTTSTVPFHPVIIRLKRYRALAEMEVVWEASYMANIMLQQGGDVTILLDMDAVHAASTGDTAFAGLEPYRGEGNQSAPPLTTPQDNFAKFTANGGKLVANKRWAQIFGMIGGVATSLVPGTQLVTDQDIAQLLLRQGTEVIDY